MNYFPEIIC